WAFAVQTQDFLDVEELYVRPQYRRQGYGTRLLQSLKKLSTQAHLPLRFFIPFADCKPENLLVAEQLLAKEGYFFLECGTRWCPLMAVQPMGIQALSSRLVLPSPPALSSPRARSVSNGLQLPAIRETDFEP